jgi:hypothetical protein
VAAAAVKVRERDVVMLLHKNGTMSLRELLQHFKAFVPAQEQKTEFIKMVANVVAIFDGSTKMAKLKETTLAQYDLKDSTGRA